MRWNKLGIWEPLVPAIIAVALLFIDVTMNGSSLISVAQQSVWGAAARRTTPPPARSTNATETSSRRPLSGSLVNTTDTSAPTHWEIVIDPRDFIPAGAPRGDFDFEQYRYPGRRIAAFPSPLVPSDTDLRAFDSTAYRVRAGDLLDIFIWGQENLSSKLRVSRDGSIVVKLAGSVLVSGLTVDQAAERIAVRLRRYVVEPAVTVSIAEFGGKDVVVVGEVDQPGPQGIDRPTHLLDVLIQAKWKRDAADLSSIRVARGDTTMVCDVGAVLRGRSLDQNILVEAGDLVIVPSREQVISVLGAVVKPGKYSFAVDRSVRVRDVILESTLWTPKANIARALILHPDGTMEPVNLSALWFQGNAQEDKVMRNGDSLIIPELTEVGVYVLGKVGTPGFLVRSGSFNLLQALSMANVSTFHARLYDVRVVRGWPGYPVVRRYSVKALLDGDLTQNVLLEPGDVVFVPEGLLSYSLQFWNGLLAPIGGTASTVQQIDENVRSMRSTTN